MASCEECNNEINSKAKVCPHCGFEKQSILSIFWGFLIDCLFWFCGVTSLFCLLILSLISFGYQENYVGRVEFYHPYHLYFAYIVCIFLYVLLSPLFLTFASFFMIPVSFIPAIIRGLIFGICKILGFRTPLYPSKFEIVVSEIDDKDSLKKIFISSHTDFLLSLVNLLKYFRDTFSGFTHIRHQITWNIATKEKNPILLAQNLSVLSRNHPNISFNNEQLYNMMSTFLYWAIIGDDISREKDFSVEKNTFEFYCWTKYKHEPWKLWQSERTTNYYYWKDSDYRKSFNQLLQQQWYDMPYSNEEMAEKLSLTSEKLAEITAKHERLIRINTFSHGDRGKWGFHNDENGNWGWVVYLNYTSKELIKWAEEFNVHCRTLHVPFEAHVIFKQYKNEEGYDNGRFIWLGIRIRKIQRQ